MSKIEKVKEIMGLGENFHMCDVSEIAEDHIHLESWDEDVNKSDFDLVAELIASDEYDIDGFELLEISFIKISENGLQNALAHSIQEAVEI